jgi:hypothetical protein
MWSFWDILGGLAGILIIGFVMVNRIDDANRLNMSDEEIIEYNRTHGRFGFYITMTWWIIALVLGVITLVVYAGMWGWLDWLFE